MLVFGIFMLFLIISLNEVKSATYTCVQPLGKACPASNNCPVIGGNGVKYYFQYGDGIQSGFCRISREYSCGGSSGIVPPSDIVSPGINKIGASCLGYSFSGGPIIGGTPACLATDPTGGGANPFCTFTHDSKLSTATWGWRVGPLPEENPNVDSWSGTTECNDRYNNDNDNFCDTNGCCSDALYTDQIACGNQGATWWLGEASCQVVCTDNDGDTFSTQGGACGSVDCNDTNSNVYPGATEACNGIDDNCVSGPDEGGVCGSCIDNDVDGYGNPGNSICSNGAATDCNDNNFNINPGATEICDDGVDNDCDTQIDEGCPCKVISAKWVPNETVVINGTLMGLWVNGPSCQGNDLINFTIVEIDPPGPGPSQVVTVFLNNYGNLSTWTALWTYPGDNEPMINSIDRNYIFTARALENSQLRISSVVNVSNGTIGTNSSEDLSCVSQGGRLCIDNEICVIPPATIINASDVPPNGACCSQNCCIPNNQSVTCGSNNCGTATNNCGQEVSCGVCSSGQVCSGGSGGPGTCQSSASCALTFVGWSKGTAVENEVVSFTIRGNNQCTTNDWVAVRVLEDDPGGDGNVDRLMVNWSTPNALNFSAGNEITLNWQAQWECDGDVGGICFGDPPEYYLYVNLLPTVGKLSSKSSGPYGYLNVSGSYSGLNCAQVTTCGDYTPFGKNACNRNACDGNVIANSAGNLFDECNIGPLYCSPTNTSWIDGCACRWNDKSNKCRFNYVETTCPTIGGCGNGVIDAGEECDTGNLGGKTCSSFDSDWSGTLSCNADCSFNFNSCTGIQCNNNNAIDLPGEFCDGDDIDAHTCSQVGNFDSGYLLCDGNCLPDTTFCENATGGSNDLGLCSSSTNAVKECSEPPIGVYEVSWSGLWSWLGNSYNDVASCDAANPGSGGCVQDGNSWYFDPMSLMSQCEAGGVNSIQCPADLKLPFFTFTQFVMTLMTILAIYGLMSLSRKRK